MKRWNFADMLAVSKKLFAKIHKRKFHAHHNHDIHFISVIKMTSLFYVTPSASLIAAGEKC
jgi:hypothetical protein